jgi:hypothetical protein
MSCRAARATPHTRARRARVRDAAVGAAIAATLAAILFAAGGWAVTPRLPAGDEPHYLVIAQSLILDHDIQIENNHKRGDYGAYFDAVLNRTTFAAERTAPSTPFTRRASPLMAPVFAAFGYTGVKAALILLSACATGLVWLIAWRCTGQAQAAVVRMGDGHLLDAVFLPCLCGVSRHACGGDCWLGVWTLVDERARRPARLLLLGLAIGALPWLHTRFAILAPR